MNKLLQQIEQWFKPAPVGVHLDTHKACSTKQPTTQVAVQAGEQLIIPLQQHTGQKPQLAVKVGDYVHQGQLLASRQNEFSVPVHASTSGTIIAIEARPIAHPSGLHDQCIVIEADGKHDDCSAYMPPLSHYQELDGDTLRQRICDAGIVGLGGAVFPSAIKLQIRPEIAVDTLVINGAECEPYITCDDMLMRDKAAQIIAGAQIMLHILSEQVDIGSSLRCLIGIEDNKPDAIQSMQAAVQEAGEERIKVQAIPTIYPAGGEKQLIQTLIGREVPGGGRPAEIGVICHNVATARAIHRAVTLGEPLISRYVTVTGPGINNPQNMEVPLGLSFAGLVEKAGGYAEENGQLIMGGPMMGLALSSDEIPVVKATNCLLVEAPANLPETALPCIRCGQCAAHCPAQLLPQQLYWYAQNRDLKRVEEYHLFDCIECGCCAYVCPSQIPLVDYYRFAKAEIREQRVAKQKAELARERHEFHIERLERAKRERAEKLAKHKKKTMSGDKKDAIQAALARAKAKKAEREKTPHSNTSEEAKTPHPNPSPQGRGAIKDKSEREVSK